MEQREALVYVIGPLKLQNELLVAYLQKETEIPCFTWLKPKSPSTPKDISAETSFFLVDCYQADLKNLWIKPDLSRLNDFPNSFIALFNVVPNRGMERDALKRNVRGIFYENEPQDQIAKGVQSILRGELWYPRVVLGDILFDEIKFNAKYKESHNNHLTPREKEVLMMIASGEANEEIAQRLSISPNTVKTHIYNIYGKIEVPNRIQAAIWAAKNL